VSNIRRVSKITVLMVLCVMATGCIVLPFGRGHGRHVQGDRHYAPAGDSQSGHSERSRERPRREGR